MQTWYPDLTFDGDIIEFVARLEKISAPLDRRTNEIAFQKSAYTGRSRAMRAYNSFGSPLLTSGAWDCEVAGILASKLALGFEIDSLTDLFQSGLNARTADDVEKCFEIYTELLAKLGCLMPSETPNSMVGTSLGQFRAWRPPSEVVDIDAFEHSFDPGDLEAKVLSGWQGQFGATIFGSMFQGASGENIESVYGQINKIAGDPCLISHPLTFEYISLEVLRDKGLFVDATNLRLPWRERLMYCDGPNAIAYDNLADFDPPTSAWSANPIHDWSGAMARSVVFGLIAPARPAISMDLASKEACVSHARDGIDASALCALATSLAFCSDDARSLVSQVLEIFGPVQSQVGELTRRCPTAFSTNFNAKGAFGELKSTMGNLYWQHCLPNVGVVLCALWYGAGDFTQTMAIVASLGHDTHTSAAVCGTVVGVLNGTVPSWWTNPAQGGLQTWLTGPDTFSAEALTRKTLEVVQSLNY